jgi:Lectin C-type domain
VAGCAAGETGGDTYSAPSQDAAPDAPLDTAGDAADDVAEAATEAGVDAAPDVLPDALPDAAPDAEPDAEPDAAADAPEDATSDAPDEGGDAEAGCPTGYTGPACDECAVGYLACGAECVDACSACAGFPQQCDGACIADCKSCTDATVACDDMCVADCSACTDKGFDCNGKCVGACLGTCLNADYACEDHCVASCTSCTGFQATCAATHECLNGCTACSGACTECPTGYHACQGGCHIDVADAPTLGCAYTCDDQPCPVPSNGQSICTNGACDITCDTANGFQKSGSECVCDIANGFVEDPNLHICVCQSGMKGCGSFCADLTDPAYGCSSPYCSACPSPTHAVATSCNAAGGCEFTCDTANGYIENAAGTACVCPSGMVDNGTSCQCPVNQKTCNGSCVSSLLPANGCAGASCAACTLPAHAAATDCSGPGATCGFVCDTANGYVLNAAGDDCTCGPGLVDYGTYCGCPGGEKVCGGNCVSTTSPSTGCASGSCDPCLEPAHAVANCSGPGGICSFSCDASGQWIVSGSQCVCASGWKDCGGTSCVDATSPSNGCTDVSCTACPVPDHATAATCGGTGGTCSFTCDATGNWVAIGGQCVCNSGWKDCGGAACVDASSPANGCSDVSCSACPLPAHATTTNCNGTGGTCDFVCDSAGHWVESGGQCVCASGYSDQGGVCVPACPGSTYGSSCYWYVSNASSWDAAQATCLSSGGHLASVADASENSFVRGLSSSTFWIGLRDYATINQSVSADDCTDNAWLSGNGGTYLGDTDEWDDFSPCGMSSDADDIFGLSVTVPGMYVLSTANSSFDTMLGLYSRINNTSDYTTCIGSSIECDDDDGPGVRSLIVRNLSVGDYTVIMDGYSGSWGSYQLDVRRFDFVDASAHAWANWAAEQPDNAGSAEDCTEVDWSSGTWNDLSCGTARPFVCERPL